MIRINLLPNAKRGGQKKTASSGGGGGGSQVWFGVYALGLIATAALCAVLYFQADDELQAKIAANNTLEQQIQTLRTRSARLEEVQALLQQSLALEEVVEELDRGRTGPTRAMMELSRILASGEGSGPTIDPAALEALRRSNPLATYNRSWDSRRLWLTRFEENQRQGLLEGMGRTNEDVAEFLRRLQLSELFDEVTLQRTEAETDRETGAELIKFQLRCRVTY